jgi:hypothetical protein
MSSSCGIGGETAFFQWKLSQSENPVVQVRLLKDQLKIVGMVTERSLFKEVMDLGIAKPALLPFDKALVDVKYKRESKQWQIIGKSAATKPWTSSEFNKLMSDGEPPLSSEELSGFLSELLSQERYVEKN